MLNKDGAVDGQLHKSNIHIDSTSKHATPLPRRNKHFALHPPRLIEQVRSYRVHGCCQGDERVGGTNANVRPISFSSNIYTSKRSDKSSARTVPFIDKWACLYGTSVALGM